MSTTKFSDFPIIQMRGFSGWALVSPDGEGGFHVAIPNAAEPLHMTAEQVLEWCGDLLAGRWCPTPEEPR